MTSTIQADAELRSALSKIYPFDSQGAANTVLTRVVWSRLCEPGDAVAGALLGALGPVHALHLLTSGFTAHGIMSALHNATRSNAGTLPDAALDSALLPDAEALSAAQPRWLARLDRDATLRDLAAAAQAGLTVLTPECPDWPMTFNDLGPHTPHLLWVRGKPQSFDRISLAVVGARACTGYGSQVTADLTAEACAAGITVVSGAAYGIDAIAHRTALATASPTIAVLAGGADRPYPAAHDQLLERITEHGVVCSELPPGTAPTRWRFLQRNRLIAALAHAVLITEAGVRSGTLNTAGHAAELGRAIGAVPGPVTSAASAGCHRLIREYNATLVTNGTELLELLGVSPNALDLPEADARELSLHVRIIDALPLRGSRSAQELATAAGIDEHKVQGALAELELLGRVRCHEGAATERKYSLSQYVPHRLVSDTMKP